MRFISFFPDALSPLALLPSDRRDELTHLELRGPWRNPEPLGALVGLRSLDAPAAALPTVLATPMPSLTTLTVQCLREGGDLLPDLLPTLGRAVPNLRHLRLWCPTGDDHRHVGGVFDALANSRWMRHLHALDVWPLVSSQVPFDLVGRFDALEWLVCGADASHPPATRSTPRILRGSGDRRELMAWDVVNAGWFASQR